MAGEIWLIRHGETAWTRSGAHTGRTDIPLTDNGRREASALARLLGGHPFALVLTSPMQRAVETCRLSGCGQSAEVDPDLREWDYGDYEGISTSQIHQTRPDWGLWKDGAPNGETVEHVGQRADVVIGRALAAGGDVALFAHGHFLRILTARWLGLTPDCGRLFALSTATVSRLGYERETRVITRWNWPTWG
jgi:broad specificity phosphatase PhoE